MNATASVDAHWAGQSATATAKFKELYLLNINITKGQVWAIDISYAKDGEWLAHAEKAVLLLSARGEFYCRANERCYLYCCRYRYC